MGASGAESLNVAASIFMGQTEAPLTIRPFLPAADAVGADDGDDLRAWRTSRGRSWRPTSPSAIEARHLLTAVIMTAPGTIMMAKIIEPETEVPETWGRREGRHPAAPT